MNSYSVRKEAIISNRFPKRQHGMASQRSAIATTSTAFAVIIVATIGAIGFVTLSQPPVPNQPCGALPGVSVVTVNGVPKCVVGPPLAVSPDGKADFRNGTVVDLHVSAPIAAVIGGAKNDIVIIANGTRIIFNSKGIIAAIYPYQGKEVFSNGTIVTFPVCPYQISTDPALPRTVYANGTALFASSNGMIVRFAPNGTCSES